MSINYYPSNLEPKLLINILYEDLNSGDIVKETESIKRLRSELELSGPPDEYYSPFGTTFKERFLIFRQLAREQLFDSIIRLFDESEGRTKGDIILILGAFNDKKCVYPLIRHLEEKRCYGCSLSLIRLYRYSLLPVIEYLSIGNKYTRSACAGILGEIDDPRTIDPLINALNDDYWNVRSTALEALGKKGDKSVLDSIIVCLSDKSVNVRKKAAKVVGVIAAGETIPLNSDLAKDRWIP